MLLNGYLLSKVLEYYYSSPKSFVASAVVFVAFVAFVASASLSHQSTLAERSRSLSLSEVEACIISTNHLGLLYQSDRKGLTL